MKNEKLSCWKPGISPLTASLDGVFTYSSTAEKGLELYKRIFIPEYSAKRNVIIQIRGGGWKGINCTLDDRHIKAHLNGDYWIQTTFSCAPIFAVFDFDCPQSIDKVTDCLSEIGFSEGQYRIFTSPSYFSKNAEGHGKSVHVFFKPELNDKPVSKTMILNTFKPCESNYGFEIFPKGDRGLRAPFGFNQKLLDPYTGEPLNLNWLECLYWILKIDPFNLGNRSKQQCKYFNKVKICELSSKQNAEKIMDSGLPGPRSRNSVTGDLAIHFFFEGFKAEDARFQIKTFLKRKHNGFSKEINRGNWRLVHHEVDAWVEWVYRHLPSWTFSKHNRLFPRGFITEDDIGMIAGVFWGDAGNQKRLFKLITYYHSLADGKLGFVYISSFTWRRLAGDHYRCFQQRLVNTKLIEIDPSYCNFLGASHSKRFRLKLNNGGKMLTFGNGKPILNYHAALTRVYSIREAIRVTGIRRQWFYDNDNRGSTGLENKHNPLNMYHKFLTTEAR